MEKNEKDLLQPLMDRSAEDVIHALTQFARKFPAAYRNFFVDELPKRDKKE